MLSFDHNWTTKVAIGSPVDHGEPAGGGLQASLLGLGGSLFVVCLWSLCGLFVVVCAFLGETQF